MRLKSIRVQILAIMLICYLFPTLLLGEYMGGVFFADLQEKTEQALTSGAEHARTLTVQQRSSEVWRLLGQVENEFARFTESLETARLRLNQAEEALDTASSRARSLQRKLKAVTSESLFPDEGKPRSGDS